MINKKLTAKIVLGLMLATPYTAFAAQESGSIDSTTEINESINVVSDDTYGTEPGISYGLYAESGNNIKLTGDEITITSNQNGSNGSRAVMIDGGAVSLGNGNSVIEINANGDSAMGVFALEENSKFTVNASSFVVNVNTPRAFALHVQNGSEDADAPVNAASVDINAENIVINGTDLGISAFSNGQMNINGNLVVNAKNAIDTRGNATININTDTDGKYTTVLNGDIVFETPNSPGDAQNSGKIINSNVNINLSGEESSWTGRAYQEYKINGVYVDKVELEAPPYHGNVTGFKMSINDGASWNMTGDSFINNVNLTDDGVINMQESATEFNATEIGLNEGIINLQGENQEVNVVTLTGEGGTVNTNSLDNKMSIGTVVGSTSVTVNGSGEIADAIYGGDATAQDLADVVTTGTGESEKSAASQITTDEGIIAGKITADVKDGEVTNYTVAKNTTNVGLSNLAAINLMTWRQENNDMNKRLGELRDSKGEHGVWARMVRGEAEYESIKNQYNYYQIGYDEKLSTDPNWTVGMFLTRTEGNSTFRTGSAENNHTGVGVYGSYLKDDGSFIDLVAKYARIDSDFNANGGVGSGDYNTNGYSVSAEYGKRFEQGNGFWIEPQVELTYGTVGAVDYTTGNGAKVRQEGMDSLVGRVGFSLGKDIKAGNIYARASYLYDFDGETEVTMSHSGISDVYEQDLGGGWFEVGVGTNINLSDATHLYFDVEKTYGGDVATPWQWSAGIRYSF